MTSRLTALVLCALLFGGLGRALPAEPPSSWEQTQDISQQRLGVVPRWQPTPEDIAALLADGLTREEAVELAVMNNTRLHAVFQELGVAAAEVRQAGLYTNPHLDALLRSPRGPGADNVEYELEFTISDLWQVPIRRDIAEARARALTMVVVNEVLNTAADTRNAHDRYVLVRSLREQAGEVLEAATAFRDEVYLREQYGYSTELDKSNADALVADQQVEYDILQSQLVVALARLQRVLGIGQDTVIEVVGDIPEALPTLVDTDQAVALALAQRPDVQIARHNIAAAEGRLRLERRSVFDRVGLGLAFERDVDGTNAFGGFVRVPLPVFDARQAGRQRARYELARSRWTSQAVEAIAREEVTVALENLGLAIRRAQLLKDEVLPARQRAFDYTSRYAVIMQLNMLVVLDARQRFFEAQRDYLEALGQVRAAQVELEFQLGGRAPWNRSLPE